MIKIIGIGNSGSNIAEKIRSSMFKVYAINTDEKNLKEMADILMV